MRADGSLWGLVAAAAATYPALGLAWCAVVAFSTDPDARALGLSGSPAALAALVLVSVGAVAVGNALRIAAIGMRQTRRFRSWINQRRGAPVESVAAVASAARWGERLTVVDAQEQIAVTIGLLRPSVVISTGLVASLSNTELRAVLAHEQAHAHRKDPLRALLGRMFAAHLWLAPAAHDLQLRARRDYELAADRHAAHRCGRRALAGALLRVTSPPAVVSEFVAPFAESGLLDARVAQLETGRPPRPARVSPLRSAMTGAGALVFLTAVTGAWSFMLIACPCATT